MFTNSRHCYMLCFRVRPATFLYDFNLLAVLLYILSTRVGEIRAHAVLIRTLSFHLTLNDRKRITPASLGYAKTAGRSSCSERQQYQQCLCANKPRTQIFGRRLFFKIKNKVCGGNSFVSLQISHSVKYLL
jgi:hypothetical protein